MTGGLMESLSVKPTKPTTSDIGISEFTKIERSWTQLMCAFQLVSVDLVAIALVLYLLAFTDFFVSGQAIAIGLSVLFALWGVSWLLQLTFLKRPTKDYMLLGHWLFWFLCSGLTYWGAQSL